MIDEKYKDAILSSIATARGYKYTVTEDVAQLENDEVVTEDPNQISKLLLGQTASYKELESVQRIIDYIKKLPNYETLVAEAREQGIELPENKQIETYRPGSIGWMRQMMDICQ
jgi:hypothetical protein